MRPLLAACAILRLSRLAGGRCQGTAVKSTDMRSLFLLTALINTRDLHSIQYCKLFSFDHSRRLDRPFTLPTRRANVDGHYEQQIFFPNEP